MEVNLDLNTDFIFKLPYNLTLSEVKLEEDSEKYGLEHALGWLRLYVKEEELPRILTAALILYQTIVPTPPLAACLHTAIVWERG